MGMETRFLPSGDTGLTVQFETGDPAQANAQVHHLNGALARRGLPGIVEIVPTLRSVLVHYDPCETTQAELIAAITLLLDHEVKSEETEARHWRLPICFDIAEYAPDLDAVAELTRSSAEKIVATFLETEQVVNMIGFAPGQPYLGDLPDWMNIPRRKDPIPRVPEGAVLTATARTVIYPTPNPTGWYVIGRTPVVLFRLGTDQPALLSPGDRVAFYEVSVREFEDLYAQRDSLHLEPEAQA